MRLQSAQTPLRKFVRPRNLVKLSRFGDRCQPAASTGFPPVFNSKGSFHPDCLEANRRTLLQRARKRASVSARQKNPAHAEAEDDSKIKDRLEALLFAETLQGTLSPNANPGKGVSWRLTELDAKSHREDAAGSPDTQSLVLDSICYTKVNGIVQGENKKS